MIRETKSIDDFGRNVILVFLGSSFVNFLNLLYQFFVAHSLSPQDFAAFNSLLSIFTLLSSPLMTLQTAVCKYTAEFRGLQEIKKIKCLFIGFLKTATGLGLITFLFFYLISFHILEKLKIASVPAAGWMLALLLASAWIMPVLLGGIQGLEMFGWFAFILISAASLKLILSVVFIRLGFNIAGALGALLVSSLAGMVVSFLPLKSALLVKSENETVAFREIFIYIFPVAASFFCFMNLVNMDMILVKVFFSPEDSGRYALAQMIGKIFLYLPAAISIVLLPKTSSLGARNPDTAATLRRSLLYASALCLIAVLTYNFFPVFVLKVLTGKVLPESIALGRLFSVSMTFFSLSFLLITYFLSLKDFRFIKVLAVLMTVQLLAIVFFHGRLIHIQAILCINSFIIFFVFMLLARKNAVFQIRSNP